MNQADKDTLELLRRAAAVADEFTKGAPARWAVLQTADVVAIARLIQREEIRQSRAQQKMGGDGRWRRSKE